MAIRAGAGPASGLSRKATPFPTPIALPPPNTTTTSIFCCWARARAASTVSRGTCGSTCVNSATRRSPSELRTPAARRDAFRLGVQTNSTCCPSASASAPTRSIAPRPKRTRGALSVQLLGERAALHHFERIGLDFQQFPIRALEVQRVFDPIRSEILDVALVELPTNAIELLPRNRDRDMVHATDRFARGRHRIFREIDDGEQVAVPQVVKPVGGAGEITVLEQFDQREADHLAVELDGALDVRRDQGQVVNAPGTGRGPLLFRLEVGSLDRVALRLVVDLGSGHRPSRAQILKNSRRILKASARSPMAAPPGNRWYAVRTQSFGSKLKTT